MTQVKLLLLAGSISLGGVLVGCDEQMAQTAKSRAALDGAIALLEEAHQGYVPEGAGDYRSFQQSRLSEAQTQLESVIAQSSDNLSKSGAHRLLAGVKSSQALVASQQAAAGFGQINARTAGLFNQLATAQRINALIVSRTGDGGAIVAALEEGQGMITQSKSGVNQRLAELSVDREAAALNAEKFRTEADAHLTRVREFEEQSEVAPNEDVKQEVFTKAYSAQVDAQAAQRKAQEQQIQAELAAQQIEAFKNEIELWDKMAQQIAELKQRVETEGADAARDVSTFGSERGLALTNVQEQVEQLVSLFREQVEAPLTTATQRMNDAVQQLDQAVSLADAGDRQALAFEQVGAKVELAGVLSRHANTTDDFSQMLTAIVENPVVSGGSAASTLQSLQSEFAQQANGLKEQARNVVSEGLAQSETMVGDTPTGQAAQGFAQALRSYGDQLN